MNPGTMSMLVELKRQDLLRQGGRGRVGKSPRTAWRSFRRASPPRDGRLLLAKARELVRLAEALGCDRDELARVISCLS